MKTTIDIPETILRDSMRLTGKKTKKEAVVTVLTDFVRKKKLESLAKQLGTFDGFISPEQLEQLRDEP